MYSSLHLPLAKVQSFLEQQDLVFNTVLAAEEDSLPAEFDAFDVKDAFLEFVSSFMMKYKKFLVMSAALTRCYVNLFC